MVKPIFITIYNKVCRLYLDKKSGNIRQKLTGLKVGREIVRFKFSYHKLTIKIEGAFKFENKYSYLLREKDVAIFECVSSEGYLNYFDYTKYVNKDKVLYKTMKYLYNKQANS